MKSMVVTIVPSGDEVTLSAIGDRELIRLIRQGIPYTYTQGEGVDTEYETWVAMSRQGRNNESLFTTFFDYFGRQPGVEIRHEANVNSVRIFQVIQR